MEQMTEVELGPEHEQSQEAPWLTHYWGLWARNQPHFTSSAWCFFPSLCSRGCWKGHYFHESTSRLQDQKTRIHSSREFLMLSAKSARAWGSGIASPPRSGCRYHQATSKLYSEPVAKLALPCSSSTLLPVRTFTVPHRQEQAGTHTLTLYLGNETAEIPQPRTPQRTSSSFVFDLSRPFWDHTYKNSWGKCPGTAFGHRDKIWSRLQDSRHLLGQKGDLMSTEREKGQVLMPVRAGKHSSFF